MFIVAQNNKVSPEINIIDIYVQLTDSIANDSDDELQYGITLASHSKRTKPQNPLYSFTQTTKYNNQTIRVCYRQLQRKKIEDWHIYIKDSKIIYVEIIKWRGNRNREMKYYFKDEVLIYPNYSPETKIMDEIDIILKAK
ncbi:hypothetical protein ACFSX9_09860 [Flavobacterium ardleyense]|uniref:Uncharacterized protein n=1 Tax=Flavobacterium ardleyense TaxID=2038737 RepID=A0ABW5Z8S3_9FLAO